LYELAGEVEKLATWAAGAEVTEADVETLVPPRAESPPWNLTDAWGARDVGAVLREAEKMLDRTGDPVSRTIPRLVGSLTRHLERARAVHRLDEQGLSPQEAASRLGMKPFPAQKLFGQVRNFSGAELDDALIRLAELDHALKGGSRLANELELERALVDITQPRPQAGEAQEPGERGRVPGARCRRPKRPAQPATSCARRRSGGARRARRPGRSASRGRDAPRPSPPHRPSRRSRRGASRAS